MEPAAPAHVLVVSNRTAATPALLDAVRERVERGPAVYFHLLVPSSPGAAAVVDRAVPLIEAASHSPVTGAVARREDPMDAIEEALHDGARRPRIDGRQAVALVVGHPEGPEVPGRCGSRPTGKLRITRAMRWSITSTVDDSEFGTYTRAGTPRAAGARCPGRPAA
jgi:hypothetical protein